MNQPVARARHVLALVAVLTASVACSRPTPATPRAPDAEPSLVDAEPPVLAHDGAVDARAARLCRTLHGAPTARRAACCEEGAPTTTATAIEAQCADVVSALLARGHATIDATIDGGPLARCEAAQEDALEGCAWVRPLPHAAPEACTGLVVGDLGEGARCASSLECEDGLRCHGASALSAGRCGKPKADRHPCGLALDPLALAVGVSEIERRHPECEGRCVLGRCAPDARGGAAPAPPVTASRAHEGERCENDLDCAEGGCVKAPGAGPHEAGTCAMKCRAL